MKTKKIKISFAILFIIAIMFITGIGGIAHAILTSTPITENNSSFDYEQEYCLHRIETYIATGILSKYDHDCILPEIPLIEVIKIDDSPKYDKYRNLPELPKIEIYNRRNTK